MQTWKCVALLAAAMVLVPALTVALAAPGANTLFPSGVAEGGKRLLAKGEGEKASEPAGKTAGGKTAAQPDRASPAAQEGSPGALSAERSLDVVLVRGGPFEMGDSFGDGADDERPVHKVVVSDFYLGKYEVTQSLWEKVMGSNPSRFLGPDRPVENVEWHDVQEFLDRLNERTGKRYRLPSEAEWEYAARDRGQRLRYAGVPNESEISEHAWFEGNSAGETHPVGQKKPNGLGVYDMGGNVWEWCQDWYGEKYYGKSDPRDPQGPSSGGYRVFRGGSWNYGPDYLRAADREGIGPAYRSATIGFRLALSPP